MAKTDGWVIEGAKDTECTGGFSRRMSRSALSSGYFYFTQILRSIYLCNICVSHLRDICVKFVAPEAFLRLKPPIQPNAKSCG